MTTRRIYGAPGQRTLDRQKTVGGPPWQLPVTLIGVAALGYVVGSVVLVAAAPSLVDRTAYATAPLTAVHLLGLAFVSVTAIAALLQLVPVILRVKLTTPIGGAIAGGGVAVGAWIMAAGFLATTPRIIAAGGVVLAVSAGVLLVESARALVRASRTETGLGATGAGIAMSLVWFAAVVVLGAMLAGNRADSFLGARLTDFLAAHAIIALGGWLGGLILAVGLRLGPMFALSHGYRRTPGTVAIAVWHVAIAVVVVGLLGEMTAVLYVGLLALVVASVGAMWFWVDVARHRRRRIEAPIIHLVAGGVFAVAAAVFVGISQLRGDGLGALMIAAALLMLIGFAVGITAGHVFKVAPMLVWTGRFAERLGTPGTPKLQDLYPARLAHVELMASSLGALLLALGVLIESTPVAIIGALLVVVSALCMTAAFGDLVFGRGRVPNASDADQTTTSRATSSSSPSSRVIDERTV